MLSSKYHMNKFVLLFVLLLLIVFLYSCNSTIFKYKIEIAEIDSKIEFTYQIETEIIRCLNHNDRQGINDLFCAKIKNTDYLKKQIDFVFDYIYMSGGLNIDNPNWQNSGEHSSQKYGKKTVLFYGRKIGGGIVINNKEYELHYGAYNILKGHKEYEGVNFIYFTEVWPDVSLEIAEERANKLAVTGNNGDGPHYFFHKKGINYVIILICQGTVE